MSLIGRAILAVVQVGEVGALSQTTVGMYGDQEKRLHTCGLSETVELWGWTFVPYPVDR